MTVSSVDVRAQNYHTSDSLPDRLGYFFFDSVRCSWLLHIIPVMPLQYSGRPN